MERKSLARTVEELEKRVRELSLLHEITRLAGSTLDWEAMLRIIVEHTARIMNAEVCSIYLLEPDGHLVLKATQGLAQSAVGRFRMKLGQGITGWVASTRQPVAVRYAMQDPRFEFFPGIDQEKFTSMLAVPLVTRDEVIGAMNLHTVEPHDFTAAEIDFFSTIAGQLAGLIEKSRLYREAEQRVQEVTALYEVSRILTTTLNLDEVLNLVLDKITAFVPASFGSIALLDPTGGELRIRAARGAFPEGYIGGARVRPGEGISGRAFQEGRPIAVADVQRDPRYKYPRMAREWGFKSLLSVPLQAGKKPIGAVNIYTKATHHFSEYEISFLSALANQAAFAIEKAQLYELERETVRRLQELDRARADFVSLVSHELRSPLTVIRTYTDFLVAEAAPEQQQYGQIIQEEVDRLNRLVENVLDAAQIEAGKLSLALTPVDVGALAAETAAELQATTERHRLVVETPPQPATAIADADRLKEVLINLINNAIKYAPQGGAIRVRVEGPQTGGTVGARPSFLISVADEGVGIPEDHGERVFQKFHRVRGAATAELEGSGLGLYITKLLVEGHGGRIWVESAAGQGSIFRFTLPQEGPPPPERPPTPPKGRFIWD